MVGPVLAVPLGDPAGVGPEIVLKAWRNRRRHDLPMMVAIGAAESLRAVGGDDYVVVDAPDAIDAGDDRLPLITLDHGGTVTPGKPDTHGARTALDSLEMGVGLARSGSVDALVTGPVSKQQLYSIGFTFPGQTEFVAERCGVDKNNVAMMLAGPTLRTVPATTHVALADVPALVTSELVTARGRAALRGLVRNFGIDNPRLAISGLNPHAGENGALGHEDDEIIAPAVRALQDEGWRVTGPHPADTMFHERARANFDCALCMYHDQALIPLKALHFDEGVNITLGLPIVRTAPDHGTAFDIAGTDRADPGAMIAALKLGGAAADCRRRLKERGSDLLDK